LASRKFNVFIDHFVCDVHFWAIRVDQRKADPLGAWPLTLEKHAFDARQYQFTNRVPLSSGLFFKLAIKRRGNIHCSANRFGLHEAIIPHMP
jgi:hypothetical protein